MVGSSVRTSAVEILKEKPEGEETRVRQTRGSGFSRYWVIVNSQGVFCPGQNASVVSLARGNIIPIKPSMCPVRTLFVIPVYCILILVHALLISSLFIDMHTSFVGA